MPAPPKRPAARASLRLAALRVVVNHFDLRRVVGEREMLRELAADVDQLRASRERVFELALILGEISVGDGVHFSVPKAYAARRFELDMCLIPALRRLGYWITLELEDTSSEYFIDILESQPEEGLLGQAVTTRPYDWLSSIIAGDDWRSIIIAGVLESQPEEGLLGQLVMTRPYDWRSDIIAGVLGHVGPALKKSGSHCYLFSPKTPTEPQRVEMPSQTEFGYFSFIRGALACEDEIVALRPRCDAFLVLNDPSIRRYFVHAVNVARLSQWSPVHHIALQIEDVRDDFEMSYDDRVKIVPLLRHAGFGLNAWHPDEIDDGITLSLHLNWDEEKYAGAYGNRENDEEGWTKAEDWGPRFKNFPPLATVVS